MTTEHMDAYATRESCLGLPLAQALAACQRMGWTPEIVYTGERAADEQFTPRVIALRENALIVALFRDGDPKVNTEVE